MKSLRWWKLAAAVGGTAAMAATAALTTTACSDDSSGGNGPCIGCGTGGEGGGGSGGGSSSEGPVCNAEEGNPCEAVGECFPDRSDPANAVCYGVSVDGVGDECFAKRKQDKSTGLRRLQYKLAWARSTEPPGNTDNLVYSVLSAGANTPLPPQCNQTPGLLGGVFQQLLDLDLTDEENIENNRVYSGWSNGVPDVAASEDAIQNGLCMVDSTYDDPAYNLPESQMTPTTGWPDSMPRPMARGERGQPATNPWRVKPAVLKRVKDDFTLANDRIRMLDEVAADEEIDGFTYINEVTGYSHSYVPLTWVVVTTPPAPIAIPIREVETTYQLNDPYERACMGAYRGHTGGLSLASDCLSPMTQTAPEFGFYKDLAPPGVSAGGAAPAKAVGYFLVTELEQVYSGTLNKTLCVSYPGNEADNTTPKVQTQGFYNADNRGCVTENWDPANNQIPKGNWCAATNSPATDTCYDAWRSETWQVFQAFPVKPPGTQCPLVRP